jgi:hypothetical protein
VLYARSRGHSLEERSVARLCQPVAGPVNEGAVNILAGNRRSNGMNMSCGPAHSGSRVHFDLSLEWMRMKVCSGGRPIGSLLWKTLPRFEPICLAGEPKEGEDWRRL